MQNQLKAKSSHDIREIMKCSLSLLFYQRSDEDDIVGGLNKNVKSNKEIHRKLILGMQKTLEATTNPRKMYVIMYDIKKSNLYKYMKMKLTVSM